MFAIFPAEAEGGIGEGDEAGVGDGEAVGVVTAVGSSLRWLSELGKWRVGCVLFSGGR